MSGSLREITVTFVFILCSLESYHLAAVYDSKQPDAKIDYSRLVRRRPSHYSDDVYMEDVYERFNVRRRPPSYILSDADLDRIIRCDFQPALVECGQDATPSESPTTTATSLPSAISTSTTTPTPLAPYTPKPTVRQLTDEEMDQIILCDFNMASTECENFESATTTITTSGTSTTDFITTTIPLAPFQPTINTITEDSTPSIENIIAFPEVITVEATSTATDLHTIVTTELPELPFLPDIPFSKENELDITTMESTAESATQSTTAEYDYYYYGDY